MQNITTECSNILNYINSNNNRTLTTAQHFHKTHCGQTDRQSEIVTYRAAFTARNGKHRCKLETCSTMPSFNLTGQFDV